MKILFAGGGTGGHIFPIIAVYREIKRIYPLEDLQFFYLGPKDPLSSILLSQEGIKIKTIMAGKIRRYWNRKSVFQNFTDIFFKIPFGILQSFFYIFFLGPDLIFSKGGYGSIPTVLSGWLLRVPIFLHESDIIPGAANRFLSRFSLEIFISFPVKKTEYFPIQKMISVGNPIRREILEGSEEKAKSFLGLTGEKPLILILGGSQGAQRINDMILAILPQMLEKFEIIHQIGEKNFEEVIKEARVVVNKNLERYYHPFPFLREEKLKHVYRAASFIIARAGAGSIFEISALGKPSILIPLPEAAQNHQTRNAYAFAEVGACEVMEEASISPRFFLERLEFLFSHPEDLERMALAAKEFSKPKAAQVIARYIMNYLNPGVF
ncbi:UDP-N-acetylglucosamine--N-acetylmuramyl-(pentapeptide) pyrophosphoryl-undecaprenol N-acetylglucosamine transferase [Patescibacteria group bacterium]|nr:UDP-N-acetylglucosamine--N-acetylmuramyl-(pentapeptide) pyrophosphoryl-undecaprenol N-acetylglucosamine transferase [Patescibacteria group bacterium]